MTASWERDESFAKWLRQALPPVEIEAERTDRLIAAVLNRVETPEMAGTSKGSWLARLCPPACLEVSLRFAVPMAAGLAVGVLAGSWLEAAEPAGLLPHLLTPAFGMEMR
ncbi:MAG: hypothetical protein H7841_00960 [Magnetospirillum sp. WYHS-4]